MREEQGAKPNSVYRYYDHAGRLIYVGITSRGMQRQAEHNESSAFWPHVTTQQVEHYPSRGEALRIERELIQVYRPPFNKVHNENWESIRAAYLAVVEAEGRLEKARAGETVPSAVRSSCSASASYNCLGTKECSLYPSWWEGPDHCHDRNCQDCHQFAHGWGVGWDQGTESEEARLPDALHFAVVVDRGALGKAAEAVLAAGDAYAHAYAERRGCLPSRRNLFFKVSDEGRRAAEHYAQEQYAVQEADGVPY